MSLVDAISLLTRKRIIVALGVIGWSDVNVIRLKLMAGMIMPQSALSELFATSRVAVETVWGIDEIVRRWLMFSFLP